MDSARRGPETYGVWASKSLKFLPIQTELNILIVVVVSSAPIEFILRLDFLVVRIPLIDSAEDQANNASGDCNVVNHQRFQEHALWDLVVLSDIVICILLVIQEDAWAYLAGMEQAPHEEKYDEHNRHYDACGADKGNYSICNKFNFLPASLFLFCIHPWFNIPKVTIVIGVVNILLHAELRQLDDEIDELDPESICYKHSEPIRYIDTVQILTFNLHSDAQLCLGPAPVAFVYRVAIGHIVRTLSNNFAVQ